MVSPNPSRRVLIVDAEGAELDGIVREISALLERSGHPVRQVIADDPPRVRDAAPALTVHLMEDPPSPVTGGALAVGDLVVCPDARVAKRAGVDLELTRIEFDLLVELLRHRNRVVTKAMLGSVWHHEAVSANAVEARISRLRAKLERLGPRVIHTVRDVGYVLHLPLEAPAAPAGAVLELVNDDLVLELAPHGTPWPAGGRL